MGAVPAWLAKYRVTASWAAHRNRNPPSLGGVDWAMPVGTPLYAPSAGVVSFLPNNGTGGHTVTTRRKDGTRTQYMHLSRFAGTAGRAVAEGDLIGYSGGAKGAPGAGSSDGPHMHGHDIDASGTRVPPFSTIPNTTPAVIPAGATTSKQRKTKTMLPLKIVDGRKLLGGGTRTYTFGPGLFLETTGHKSANSIANLLIGLLSRTPNLSYAELADYARASGACDPQLLERIEAAAKS